MPRGGNHRDARPSPLSVADARDLAQGALRGIGYHNDEARIITDHVIDAAMCGYEYSGLAAGTPARRHTASARHQPDCDCGSLVARTDRTRYRHLSLHDDRGDVTRRLGELLPEGAAPGPGGEPTRDPTAARRGALLPFDGYKGFGLALMMQALGLLAGSGLDVESEYGYLFVAFRPDLLGSADAFERQVTQLIERIKATPRQPGVDDIRIPSERAFRSRERALRAGLGDRPGGIRWARRTARAGRIAL